MKIVSLNVGRPREVAWHGRTVSTGIFKEPVAGRVALRKLNLEGDEQADLRVHGGEYKAVYCYPVEHYSYWKRELGRELPMGMFGENFTTEGVLENAVNLGDRFSVGSAEVVVTQILPAGRPRRRNRCGRRAGADRARRQRRSAAGHREPVREETLRSGRLEAHRARDESRSGAGRLEGLFQKARRRSCRLTPASGGRSTSTTRSADGARVRPLRGRGRETRPGGRQNS